MNKSWEPRFLSSFSLLLLLQLQLLLVGPRRYDDGPPARREKEEEIIKSINLIICHMHIFARNWERMGRERMGRTERGWDSIG